MNSEEILNATEQQITEWTATNIMGWPHNPRGKYLVSPVSDNWWSPYTNHDDAFEMLAKLREQKWEMSLTCDQKITEPWDCRLFLVRDGNPEKRVIAHGSTATLAMCRAMLLTLV